MPELVTHAIAGHFVTSRARREWLPLVLAGALLPDLLTRIPNLFFNLLDIPAGEDWFRPLHSPLPLAAFALLLSFAFAEEVRRRVFSSLLLGIASHLVLDFLQKRSPEMGWQVVAERGYQWLFPFSHFDFQLGIYGQEASLWALPFTVAAFWISIVARRRKQPPEA